VDPKLSILLVKGYDDIVKLLLKKGAPVNTRVAEDNSTPLHKACAGSKPGHLPAVRLLLVCQADVHALNKWRETPLLTAANHGNAGAVELLLAAGADPCKCTDTGWSPLSIAAYKGHDEVVRLLLEEGAPTEEEDPTLSALLQAATKGLADTVELLLQNGADHTVTTKKGDTALSILVEQNLIDAAVTMVTKYSASISRCSRDRKKVQRARLLINLRMKQMEREGKNGTSITDECETDDDDDSEGSQSAQHDGDAISPQEGAAASAKKKKKKNKGGASSAVNAEEIARAAEEALLLELAEEDEKAKAVEAGTSSKKAKKKKKKERERQQKMKEEEERRVREEREQQEREMRRKEREEKQRLEKEQKLKEQQEREIKELMEREKAMAAKRKKRERREREQQLKQREKDASSVPPSPSGSADGSEKRGRSPKTTQQQSQAQAVSQSAGGTGANVAPLAGNRRWETKGKSPTPNAKNSPSNNVPPMPTSAQSQAGNVSTPSTFLSPRTASSGSDLSSTAVLPVEEKPAGPIAQPEHEAKLQSSGRKIEHPAITLFRREKVSEMIQRCSLLLGFGEVAVKRILYRWIIRASHDKSSYVDPIIPSWTDAGQLSAYFQRQLITESRHGGVNSQSLVNPEALKEAGSSVAMMCQALAKEVAEVRQRVEVHLPREWSDSELGMAASEGMLHHDAVVALSWANRCSVNIPAATFAALRERYFGPPNRFLTAVFVAKLWYETKEMLATNTGMCVKLPPATQATLYSDAAVTAELASDPFSAFETNVFWGCFEEVDYFFGGQPPFSKDGLVGENVLARHGGSVSVIPPPDYLIASQYVNRMVDILDAGGVSNTPVSFALFLPSDCFRDSPQGPSPDDLSQLAPRLGDSRRALVQHVEVLRAGKHFYRSDSAPGGTSICDSGSLFVLLQNEAAISQINVTMASIVKIVNSVSTGTPTPNDNPMVSPIGFSGNFGLHEPSPIAAQPQPGFFDTNHISAAPQRVVSSDFGAVGGSAIPSPFSSANEPMPRGLARPGRLFDLVDNGEDDQVNDVDLVSGMLNNLGVGLFQNGGNLGSDVDIEAISLMGIGGPPLPSSRTTSSSSQTRPFR